MKFRKRPVVIEAVQYFSDLYLRKVRIPAWYVEAWAGGTIFERNGIAFIGTLEGEMQVSEGDWVVRGVKGELYPCKPDIFELTYELAE